MKRHISKLTLAALVILAASQLPAWDGGRQAAEIQAIKDNEVRWNRDFEKRDVEKMLAHYTDDAIMMAPGFPVFNGKAEIRAMLTGMIADPALSLKFQTLHVEVSPAGDMASTQGSFTMTMTDPATKKVVSSGGSYVTVYKKLGGEWKALFDIATAGPEEAK